MDHPVAERLFVMGDAAGYIEPFTGEGITWALAAAEALTPLVVSARSHWDRRLQRAWHVFCRDVMGRRQRLCRGFAWLLRSPGLVNVAMRVLTVAPNCSIPLVRYWNRAIHCDGNISL
jgi:2-polyprenyl-6-methoxyphenol hydroxylase-like FAD-dependent oxidoreductase